MRDAVKAVAQGVVKPAPPRSGDRVAKPAPERGAPGLQHQSPRSESVRRQEPPHGITSDTRLAGAGVCYFDGAILPFPRHQAQTPRFFHSLSALAGAAPRAFRGDRVLPQSLSYPLGPETPRVAALGPRAKAWHEGQRSVSPRVQGCLVLGGPPGLDWSRPPADPDSRVLWGRGVRTGRAGRPRGMQTPAAEPHPCAIWRPFCSS